MIDGLITLFPYYHIPQPHITIMLSGDGNLRHFEFCILKL